MMHSSKKSLHALLMALIVFVSFMLAGCNTNPDNRNKESDREATAQNGEPRIISEKLTYLSGRDTLVGYLYYDENSMERRPAIIVVPEWWGNNDYPRMRAEQLAKLGYTALSADMFGNGLVVDNPKAAQENAGKLYANPVLMKARMQAAYDLLNKNDRVEKGKIAAIGYCFGGAVCLNAASMGVPLDAIVSFHGILEGFKASGDMKNTWTLVCNGKADKFVTKEHIDNFKQEMDQVKAPYEFKEYDNATHAFTNPAATENGKKFNMPIEYNEQAANQSWQDMKNFFAQHFPTDK